MACPKGTTLQGGTGPNHKGGKCVAVTKAKAATHATTAEKAKPATATTHPAQTAVKHKTQPQTTPSTTQPMAKPQAKS